MKTRALGAVLLCVACRDDTRQLPNLSCFDADEMKTKPVVYGSLTPDASAPGGWSGVEVLFGVNAAGGLTARVREARGESAQPRPVDQVRYDARHDSITFTYRAAGNTKFTRTFRPSCDELAGFTTYFRAASDSEGIAVADTLPRVKSAS